jgi:hypothetical protein
VVQYHSTGVLFGESFNWSGDLLPAVSAEIWKPEDSEPGKSLLSNSANLSEVRARISVQKDCFMTVETGQPIACYTSKELSSDQNNIVTSTVIVSWWNGSNLPFRTIVTSSA